MTEPERKQVHQEHDLEAWTFKDIPLGEMPGRFAELIERFSPDATFYIGGESPYPRVEYLRPETDEEMAARLRRKRIDEAKPDLFRSALAKLTPDEVAALGVSGYVVANYAPKPGESADQANG